jgi:hypothetical protein
MADSLGGADMTAYTVVEGGYPASKKSLIWFSKRRNVSPILPYEPQIRRTDAFLTGQHGFSLPDCLGCLRSGHPTFLLFSFPAGG